MDFGSETLTALIRQFAKMPGVGAKSAQRLALYLLRTEEANVVRLAETLQELRSKVRFCRSCGSITEDEECAICKDSGRNRALVCVVEEPPDVLVMEKTRQYNGLYHVLHGVLSPVDGVGPDQLNLARFVERVQSNAITEVIVATNPTIEGDTTALYIAKALESVECTVTRLARGLPMGGTLEFADDVTIARALERREPL